MPAEHETIEPNNWIFCQGLNTILIFLSRYIQANAKFQ